MSHNELFMERCLELAKNGLGNVAPNPMAGAIVVYDNKIIGEGYHQKFGENHAEVNALNSVKNINLIEKSTLYVNLEPCSHIGKTGPCADFIIQKKVKKVVIGSRDFSSKVNGKGIEKLKDAGVLVAEGVLEKDCMELNKRFFTYHLKNRPYIILKWAQTKNGFFASNENIPFWITNDKSRQLVHLWRSQEQSIIIGTNTVHIDNPYLTVREVKGNNPVRVIIDRNLNLPQSLNIFNDEAPTLIFNKKVNKKNTNIEFIKINFGSDILKEMLYHLWKKEVQSLIVEGGKKILMSFIEQNLWDEARVFTGIKELKNGIQAPIFNSILEYKQPILEDELCIFKNE